MSSTWSISSSTTSGPKTLPARSGDRTRWTRSSRRRSARLSRWVSRRAMRAPSGCKGYPARSAWRTRRRDSSKSASISSRKRTTGRGVPRHHSWRNRLSDLDSEVEGRSASGRYCRELLRMLSMTANSARSAASGPEARDWPSSQVAHSSAYRPPAVSVFARWRSAVVFPVCLGACTTKDCLLSIRARRDGSRSSGGSM